MTVRSKGLSGMVALLGKKDIFPIMAFFQITYDREDFLGDQKGKNNLCGQHSSLTYFFFLFFLSLGITLLTVEGHLSHPGKYHCIPESLKGATPQLQNFWRKGEHPAQDCLPWSQC